MTAEYFDDEELERLVRMVNSSAKTKCKMDISAKVKGSMYSKWTSFIKLEVLRYTWVTIAKSIQPRLKIKDYLSRVDIYHTLWLKKALSRERLEAIRHTMLHTSDENEKK